ncbi:hypothetical protein [Sandaracinus amylolyticus]|uniref:hypothetical protein n=1 Tax=Sandaracinus amylolyticus TaxID=927083 RepID=UPI001F234381|nr:hypothetical protein [Sandaracinus amylolyticus]UJR87100.1 Hypothetical protein I5071_92010 [Sandaracinus amylolyticus]
MHRGCGIALLLLVASACGNGGSGRRAGSEPLPSSEPSRPAPASGGAQAPMFAGASRGGEDRARALAGTPMMEAERRRREALERAQGPERLEEDRMARGRAIAAEMRAAAAESARDEGDECQQAWAAQGALREELPAAGRPSEEEFLRTCRAMPERERRCMSPVYFEGHLQECAEAQAETMARIRREGRMRTAEGRGRPVIEVDVAPTSGGSAAPQPAPETAAPAPRRVPMPE